MFRVVLLLTALLAASSALAAVPSTMTYQGFLKDAQGLAITGTRDLAFSIYTDSLAGTAVWQESYAGTSVISGIFTVQLGSQIPLTSSIFSNANLWMQTSVGGTPLLPRSRLTTNPYAYRASVADSVVGGGTVWSLSGSNAYRLVGNVGIGTSSPGSRLTVAGIIESTTGGVRLPDGTTLASATFASGVTLDQAYDHGGAGAGRTINATAGAVNITGTGTGLTVNGSVGVGTTTPGSKLTVAGVIESTAGGIKFPDGTIQLSASAPETFAACVNFSGTACTTIYCDCGTAQMITRVTSDCTVTSQTGSCSALSFSCSGGGIGHGTCCVCAP